MSQVPASNAQRFEKNSGQNAPLQGSSQEPASNLNAAGPRPAPNKIAGHGGVAGPRFINRPLTSNRDHCGEIVKTGAKRSAEAAGLYWTPLGKLIRTDPLVGHGRHFGRTVRTFCRVHTLLSNGLSRTMQLDLGRIMEEDLSESELAEHRQYQQLLALSPGLGERLNTGTEGDLRYSAVRAKISKGMGSARSDDTKSLKSAVVDWITPPNQVLSPPLQRNVKTDRGFHHSRTGELLCPVNFDWNDPKIRRNLQSGILLPSGDMWPRFLFKAYQYNPEDPWDGLFRSSLLVKAYKHVFTSPSSVYSNGGASKSTKSSNARLNGMTSVTIASIAYIATQVRFALCSGSMFSRTDRTTDSEFFYELIIDVLEDPEEYVEVSDLLRWWNQQIFPAHQLQYRSVHGDSVAAKIKERRRQIQDGTWNLHEVGCGALNFSQSQAGATPEHGANTQSDSESEKPLWEEEEEVQQQQQ